jgi:hypothetical protein
MGLESTQPQIAMSKMGVESGRRVGLTTLPPSMSRMSENVWASTSRNHKGLHGLYRDNFTLRYLPEYLLAVYNLGTVLHLYE